MEDKKIIITKHEFLSSHAHSLANNDSARELIAEHPELLLLFAHVSSLAWQELVEIHENDQVENN